MKRVLLDTNVISELIKPSPNTSVVGFVSSLPLHTIYISVVTLAEIRYGIALVSDPERRAKLANWLDHSIRPMFGDRVLPITEDIMIRWRILLESGRKSGHTYSQPDLIIAATGLEHDLTIATRNTADFLPTGANVINPWQH